MLTYVNY